MRTYADVKRVYRAVLPEAVRSRISSRRSPLRATLLRAKAALERSAAHDEIYDHTYYERSAAAKRESMLRIAKSITRDLSPITAVDVGCGGGYLLSSLTERGVECLGLERSEAGLDICRRKGLRVREFDIAQSTTEDSFDVAVSLEVAEHLPAALADRLVDLLAGLARTVVFTAAPPGQGGASHLNEQPREYWIRKFEARSLVHRQDLVDAWRAEWKPFGVLPFYWKNLMVFSRVS